MWRFHSAQGIHSQSLIKIFLVPSLTSVYEERVNHRVLREKPKRSRARLFLADRGYFGPSSPLPPPLKAMISTDIPQADDNLHILGN